jgi:cation diffusion facilitator family transporter
MKNSEKAYNSVWFSIIGNILLTIIKGITAFFGNSFALLADAIESLTDVFSSVLVLFGLKYSNRPADKNHPYGHGRLEPLITFLVVGILITSALYIAHESIQNINTPHEAPKVWTLFILFPLILWKEISYQIVIKKAKELKSNVLKADAWHHRSDAITSVTAFIGISISLYFGKGYESADDWAALLASVFILYNCYQIFRPALAEIMDEHTHDDVVRQIRNLSLLVIGVIDTEKCFVRKSGTKYHVELHVIVDAEISVKEGHRIAHKLKDFLRENMVELGHVLIHVEPN